MNLGLKEIRANIVPVIWEWNDNGGWERHQNGEWTWRCSFWILHEELCFRNSHIACHLNRKHKRRIDPSKHLLCSLHFTINHYCPCIRFWCRPCVLLLFSVSLWEQNRYISKEDSHGAVSQSFVLTVPLAHLIPTLVFSVLVFYERERVYRYTPGPILFCKILHTPNAPNFPRPHCCLVFCQEQCPWGIWPGIPKTPKRFVRLLGQRNGSIGTTYIGVKPVQSGPGNICPFWGKEAEKTGVPFLDFPVINNF